MKIHWELLGEEEALKVRIMTVLKKRYRSPELGRERDFFTVHAPTWCNIIPVTEDGKIVLIRQFRVGVDQVTLEIPGGVVDAEETVPREAALRELAEETGYTPLPGSRVENLGWTWSNPPIFDNKVHSYVVGPVRKTANPTPDPDELIEVLEVPIQEIPSLIMKGEITHGLLLVGFLKLALSQSVGTQALETALQAFTASKDTRS